MTNHRLAVVGGKSVGKSGETLTIRRNNDENQEKL